MIDRDREARLSSDLRGDRPRRDRALAELVELTRSSLNGLALRITGRADLAQDALQETFVDVLRGIDGFRGDARLTTWLYRIAVRAALRVAGRTPGRGASLPEELATDRDDPAEAHAQREGAARILAALSELPAPQRAVLALSALDELPQSEIATVLGIPPGTVYSRLHHARERLRVALERERA